MALTHLQPLMSTEAEQVDFYKVKLKRVANIYTSTFLFLVAQLRPSRYTWNELCAWNASPRETCIWYKIFFPASSVSLYFNHKLNVFDFWLFRYLTFPWRHSLTCVICYHDNLNLRGIGKVTDNQPCSGKSRLGHVIYCFFDWSEVLNNISWSFPCIVAQTLTKHSIAEMRLHRQGITG